MHLKKITNKYKIIFSDLDDTLIKTHTKETFPKGIWDMEIKFDVLDKIKELNPEYLFIVTNQGGIGKFVNGEHFESKLEYIKNAFQEYIGCIVDVTYCPSTDKSDPDRKPNPGMANKLIEKNNLSINTFDFCCKKFDPSECLMIGDASGYPGQFSDSDKKFAENCFGGIDYIDVKDLLGDI